MYVEVEREKMNILVTGATGFMGTYLVSRLIECGYKVRALVRDEDKARRVLDKSCEIFVGDIEKEETLIGCCDNIDVVYHMAALMGHDSPSPEAFEKFRKVNVNGVTNIIREAKKSNVVKFIHISSTAAMGLQKTIRINEETECRPYTPYQVTKREGELCVLAEFEKSGFPAVVIRPSMVYGPGFKGDFLTLAKVCKSGWFPKIGSGANLSPALYITDLVEALVKVIDKGKTGEIYMLSSKESYTLKETAEIIGSALGKKIRFVYIPRNIAIMGAGILEFICRQLGKKPPVTKRNIQSVSTDRIVDISKLSKALEYEPSISLDIGLPKTIRYFVEQKYL